MASKEERGNHQEEIWEARYFQIENGDRITMHITVEKNEKDRKRVFAGNGTAKQAVTLDDGNVGQQPVDFNFHIKAYNIREAFKKYRESYDAAIEERNAKRKKEIEEYQEYLKKETEIEKESNLILPMEKKIIH